MEAFGQPQRIKMAANLAAELLVWAPPVGETWFLESLDVLPNATSAANGTDYASYQAFAGIGSPTALCAARTTESTALTSKTIEAVTFSSGTTSNREITRSNPLSVSVDTSPGSGVAIDLTFIPTFTKRRA